MKRNFEKGITLIALVITIIILIILGGVSISLIMNQDGIINKAKMGSKLYREEQAKERLEIILAKLLTDKVSNKDYNENEYLNNVLESNDISVEGDIVIVDGWQFEINRQTLKIVESLGEETGFIKATRKKANFIYDSEATYLSEAEVEINVAESAKTYTVQYNTEESDENSSNWTTYTLGNKFKVSKNGTIYGRFINLETNEIGYKFKIEINNIDEIEPENASIELDKQVVNTGETINITVTMNDNESGILTSNCKYIVNETETEIGIDSTLWDSATAFTSNPQTIPVTKSEIKSYHLHVLSVDAAGNKIETISQKFRFKGVTTYLNMNKYFGWTSDMKAAGFSVVNSYQETSLMAKAGKIAYIVSDKMYDITDINKLTFYCSKVRQGSSVYDRRVKFGVSKIKKSTDFDLCATDISTTGDGITPLNMELDTSNLTGEYYIKVSLECVTNSSTWEVFMHDAGYIKGY